MIKTRNAETRGHFNHGWLNTYHTFSFADYQDPKHTRFRTLRVINEDFVAPGAGFPTHSHRDMEIITYLLKGELEHKDSMGNTSVIRPGEVQKMTAGSGVTHSEFNPSPKNPVHLLQIWIFPSEKSLTPGYQQKVFNPEGKNNQLRIIVSPDKRDGSIQIYQDALIYDCRLEKGKSVNYSLKKDRGVWIQVIEGEVAAGKETLKAGDGASIENEAFLEIKSKNDTEFLFFDLA